MVDVPHPKYRKTGNRMHILVALSSAQESLENAARAMEQDDQRDPMPTRRATSRRAPLPGAT